MNKPQNSLSDNAGLLGRPTGAMPATDSGVSDRTDSYGLFIILQNIVYEPYYHRPDLMASFTR